MLLALRTLAAVFRGSCLAGAMLGVVQLTLGCATSECPDSQVLVDGQCVARCDDDSCGSALYCVRSVCRPECERDSDCEGQDTCETVKTDQGRSGRYCYGLATSVSLYDSVASPEAGVPTEDPNACETSDECDQSVPRHCIDKSCVTACTLHQHCGRAGACSGNGSSDDAQSVSYCQSDAFPRAEGQYGSVCLQGNSECDGSSAFRCVSGGDGDTESYCTRLGCEGDQACPSGYFCSENTLGSRPPCSSACGLVGDPADPDCIPADQIGAGKEYACASVGTSGLSVHLCLKRGFCSACESDADCRGEPNQVCAKGPDGTKTCTVLCEPGAGSCPWGVATACEVFDTDLGLPTCGHRFGACRGTGKGCEPCVDDTDCPNGFCSESGFTGERFCLDARDTCSCPAGQELCVGGGCPLTPGGTPMNCVPGASGPPSLCYGSELDQAGGTPLGCWQ